MTNLIGTIDDLIPKMLKLDRDKKYELKPYVEKRSINANDYCWVLCQKIAEVVHSTKTEIYRKAIREIGVYATIDVDTKASQTFIKGWEHNGIGWLCEVENQNEDKTNLFAYYGSSVYNKKAMSVLIDYIVEEAKGLNIETKTPNEIANLKSMWGKE